MTPITEDLEAEAAPSSWVVAALEEVAEDSAEVASVEEVSVAVVPVADFKWKLSIEI